MDIPHTDPVPAHYLGLWRRARLTTPTRTDTTTRVYWLQTERWHADLRIPLDRPTFDGVQKLGDCSDAQLRWLLTQSGFAGITRVIGDECEWLRQIDYRPSGERDIGRMVFHGESVEEFGVEDDYDEWWDREPASRGAQHTQVGLDGGRVRTVLAVSGDWFIRCRARQIDAATEADHWAAVRAGRADRAMMQALADFELSLGQGDPAAGRIVLSTLPWLEQLHK